MFKVTVLLLDDREVDLGTFENLVLACHMMREDYMKIMHGSPSVLYFVDMEDTDGTWRRIDEIEAHHVYNLR